MLGEIALIAKASAAMGGLTDLGPEDGFRVSLRVLLAALEEAGLPDSQRQAMLDNWQKRIEVRMQLMAVRAADPSIGTQEIEGPMLVTGLPRTGTTSLFDVLAQDPAVRAPLTWETMTLAEPARPGHWHDDPRIARIDDYLGGLGDPVAEAGLHTYGAMLPDECNNILLYNFWGARYPGEPEALWLKGASEWIHNCVPPLPFRLHRMVLQHLQAHGPGGRWLLKEPYHINALDHFIAEYPGAMIVMTHRDPVDVFTSLAGLYATIRGEGPGDPGRPATGRYVLERWSAGLKRCMAARQDPALDARIIDIGYSAIVTEPMATVEAIYRHFDLPLPDAARARMEAWLANPAQHRSATRFALEDFALTPEDILSAISPYPARFGRYF